ncbi:hypothetical protein AXG55_01285 [Silvanigrella aquatica]|uniref:AB hydrolase-1 domain-containing protein n=2 Tax=Silvanigrella aquatica TaxID=1915309 RepID=A0A1L4CXG5_9BACT|nr:hypothetical protein AXG55_01285 [Silvanigrella aquatica]
MSFWLSFEAELLKYSDIILIDLLGTGGSQNKTGRFTIKKFAEDVLYTLKYCQVFHFHLAGISLGGMVALEMAKLMDKQEWKELKLHSNCIMSSSSGDMGHKRIFFIPLLFLIISFFTSILKGFPSHKLFSKFLVSNKTLENNTDIVKQWDEIWQKEGFSHLSFILQIFAAANYKSKLKNRKINTPFLFLVSKEDKLVPWLNSVLLWEKIPQAELRIFRNLGHDLTTDDPECISKIIYDFMKRNEI